MIFYNQLIQCVLILKFINQADEVKVPRLSEIISGLRGKDCYILVTKRQELSSRPEFSNISPDHAISFMKKKIRAPIIADTGIVSIHAQNIFVVTPHFTAEALFVAPTPIIEPVIV